MERKHFCFYLYQMASPCWSFHSSGSERDCLLAAGKLCPTLASHNLGNFVLDGYLSLTVAEAVGGVVNIAFLGLPVIAVEIYFQSVRDYPPHNEKQYLGVLSLQLAVY